MSILDELKQSAEKLSGEIVRLRTVTASSDATRRLVVRKNSLYVSVGNNTYKYLGKEQMPLAKQLAQERYDRIMLKIYEDQSVVIEQCIKKLEKLISSDDVYSNLPEAIRNLILPDEFTTEGFAVKWQDEKFRCKRPPEGRQYFTAKGEHVRSKSEVIIADRLNTNGIPYHYETAVSFDGEVVQYPDFMVLNKRTRKVLFWEHFGMMDNSDYLNETLQKLESFESDGLLLGRDLIVTFESSEKPLSTKHIDKIIEDYLK